MRDPKIEALLDELHDYASDIRRDWSDFDGRDLLRFVMDWIDRMKQAQEATP